ncbi:MAG: LysO family transporter [Bacteroidales bacterium]|nr:LysO family transporter [Bacteroidales bacterium]
MIEVLLLMVTGIVSGYFMRKKSNIILIVEKLIIISIFLLLFFMGLSIGRDPLIISQLPSLGMVAVLLGIGGILGSMFLALVVGKFFFFRKSKDHADES